MSYTEIFGFTKDNNVIGIGDVRNAFRGAMAVWHTLEKKYLPTYHPSWAPMNDGKEYFRSSALGDDKLMREVWSLADNEKVSEVDKIALKSTFDKVIVRRENFGRLIEAFRAFEGETSLKEQADIIEGAGPEVIAIGWNQTSVNGDTWQNFGGYDEETEESIPYNLETGEDHWELFGEEDSTVSPA